jgi:hypothetical protein
MLTLPETRELQNILQEDTGVATWETLANVLIALALIAALIYIYQESK